MRWVPPDDRGAVTAEFAIVLPTALLVLACILSGVLLGAHRVVLTSAAADLSRLEARGDTILADERISQLPTGTRVERGDRGALRCVTLSATPARGLLSAVPISATACAAKS